MKPLSPYAVSKMSLEKYSEIFSRNFNIPIIIFRIFNVFIHFNKQKVSILQLYQSGLKIIQKIRIYVFLEKKLFQEILLMLIISYMQFI